MSKSESRPRLTATRKFELYLATRSKDAPLGELLRQYGVHLDDLRQIEGVVESSALAGLKAHTRRGRQPTDLSPARVQQLEQELAEKTHALVELSVSYTRSIGRKWIIGQFLHQDVRRIAKVLHQNSV